MLISLMLISLITILLHSVVAIQFQYTFHQAGFHCFHDLLYENLLVTSKFSTDSKDMTVTISGPNGFAAMKASSAKESQIIMTFTTQIAGNYTICLIAYKNLICDVDYASGLYSYDTTEVAKKGDLIGIEKEIQTAENMLNMIRMQLKFIIQREDTNKSFTEIIDYKVMGFSVLMMAVLFTLAYIFQRTGKQYFYDKKLM